MRDHVRRRPRYHGPTRGRTRPIAGTFAPALLALGVLAGAADIRLGAQEAPPATPPARTESPRILPPAQPQAFPAPAVRRFRFTIDPKLAPKDLLPAPPPARAADAPGAVRTLAEVPEVDFQAPPAKGLPAEEALRQIAHVIAKVNHVNGRKSDGFMEALRGERPDLAGLPFMMGDSCRLKGDRSRELTRAVATVRAALRPRPAVLNGTAVAFTPPAVEAPPAPTQAPPAPPPVPPAPAPSPPVVQAAVDFAVTPLNLVVAAAEHVNPETFWEQYAAACAQEDKQVPPVDRARQENVLLARIAALAQVLAPEPPAMRLGLVKYLAAVSHAEATRALARLAIFSEEDDVRRAAVEALKVRRERDFTDVLLASLRYPWPAVARRGAEALAALERSDLVPQLVDLLDRPDPRAPVAKAGGGPRGHEVRELVRVNHHRNCLLCHAPANAGGVSPETLTAAVPVPGEPLPSPFDGYQAGSPDAQVRIDVTYLRPDFSALVPVADAHPWPEMQRFDYLVRTRAVTDEEAAAARRALAAEGGDRPSPYQRAVLAALRELTGKDTAPTAEAWRKLLNLPAGTSQAALAR